MLKRLKQFLGSELKTPKDFLFFVLFLGLLALMVYATGLVLYFVFYIFGYHVFLTSLYTEFTKVFVGEVPFFSTYAQVWLWFTRAIQNADIIRTVLAVILFAILVIGHVTLLFLLFMLLRGIVSVLWRLVKRIVGTS
jgi:hypothetical protein